MAFVNGLYECGGLGNATPAPVALLDWQVYNWPSKTLYHQAGRPAQQYSDWLASHSGGGTGSGTGSSSGGGSNVPPNCSPGYHVGQPNCDPGQMCLAVAPMCVADPAGSITGVGPGAGDGSSSGGGGILDSISSAFSGIPTSYLLIGGAIVAVMVLKKR